MTRCGRHREASLLRSKNAGHHHHYLSLSLISQINMKNRVHLWVWVGFMLGKKMKNTCFDLHPLPKNKEKKNNLTIFFSFLFKKEGLKFFHYFYLMWFF